MYYFLIFALKMLNVLIMPDNSLQQTTTKYLASFNVLLPHLVGELDTNAQVSIPDAHQIRKWEDVQVEVEHVMGKLREYVSHTALYFIWLFCECDCFVIVWRFYLNFRLLINFLFDYVFFSFLLSPKQFFYIWTFLNIEAWCKKVECVSFE